MCIEQATFAHGVIHLFETGHGNSEAQQIGLKVGTHGRIKEAEETALTIFLVFENSEGYNGSKPKIFKYNQLLSHFHK